jgi:hypothetical protein
VERKRIERHGGIVEAFKDEDGSDFGPKRVWNGEMTAPGLAMSRSIGDGYAHQFGVSSVPDVWNIRVCPEDRFIVIASDGVFEF